MHCSNHFCGANAIRPYHLPVVANLIHHKPKCVVRIIFVGRMRFTPTICPLWQIASAPYPKALFGKGGCHCADIVVAVVRKGWLPLFGNGGLQMPFATLADGICNPRRWHLRPLQMAFAHHLFRTSSTTTSEHRPPGFSNIVHHLFRRPTAAASNTYANCLVHSQYLCQISSLDGWPTAARCLPFFQYFNQSFLLSFQLPTFTSAALGCNLFQTLFFTLPKFNFELQRYVFLFKQTKTFFLKSDNRLI